MPSVETIPFSNIPHQSALFLSYLERSPNAMRFYPRQPTLEGLGHPGKLAHTQFHRRDIASILRKQNTEYGGGASTMRNVDSLEQPDCFAIMTGQQVGLFGGPLYTIYKALTSIRISEELSSRGIKAVPVFWMDSDDHDLLEVTIRTVLSNRSSLQTIDYSKAVVTEIRGPMPSVGSIIFADSVREAVKDYLGRLPDSAWKPDIESKLHSAYKPGSTFSQAFARLMADIFRGYGLVLFDPHDAEAKRLLAPVFQTALRQADAIREALLKRNDAIKSSGFHAQVSVLEKSTSLFLQQDGGRHSLEKRDAGFALRDSDHVFSLCDLLDIAERSPERFSPNVLLRPIVQDHSFPTLAYVGGPSEVAYFAQIAVLYEIFKLPMPVIWPRNSFTIVEEGVAAELDRFGVAVPDCFRGDKFLMERVIRTAGYSKAVMIIQDLRQRIDQALNEIRPRAESMEPSLKQALETSRRKIMHNLERLKSRSIRVETTQDSSVGAGIELLLNNCYPKGHLQERELGFYDFVSRRGPSILNTLYSVVEIGDFAHRVVRLGGGRG